MGMCAKKIPMVYKCAWELIKPIASAVLDGQEYG